jgi:tetratricopeptide (TPR) repeat protein
MTMYLKPLGMTLLAWGCAFALAGAEEPPYKRLLTGDDAKKAAALQKRIDDLWSAGQFEAAVPPAEELAALRQRVQGEKHWETADARRLVRTLKQAAALPAELQQQLAEVLGLRAKADDLEKRGRYAEEQQLRWRILGLVEKLLGPQHAETARDCNDLAFVLEKQGKYGEAETHFRRAVEIHERVLGPEHPKTSTTYHNLAGNLGGQGKYAEAETFQRRALDAREHVLGPEHPATTNCLNNLASILESQGKLVAAETVFRRALYAAEKRDGPRHLETVTVLSNLANLLRAQGKLIEAETLNRRVLDVRESVLGSQDQHIATSLNNLAIILQSQGKYVEAEPLIRRALNIREKHYGLRHSETATVLNNLASNLHYQGKDEEAETLLHHVVDILEKVWSPQHPNMAVSYNNLAVILRAERKFADADRFYRRALDVFERLFGSQHPYTATSYHNLAYNLQAQGKYAEAEALYRRALALRELVLGTQHPDTARSYHLLALNLIAQGKYAEGETDSQKAVLALEAARFRIAATGFARAVAVQDQPHKELTLCLAGRQRPIEAWEAAEAGLARGLLDDLLARQLAPGEPEQTEKGRQQAARLEELDRQLLPLLVKNQLTEDAATRRDALSRERQKWQAEIASEASQESRRHIFPLERIQRSLAADSALVFWMDDQAPPNAKDPGFYHWACVVRHAGTPAWVRLPGSGPDRAWIETDDKLPAGCRTALAERLPEWESAARRLSDQRLKPLEPHLQGVSRLFIVPAGWMAGVPIEVLAPGYQVSYVPSGTILARLVERHRPLWESSLLALGDPTFRTPTTAPPPLPPDHGLLIVQVLPGGNAARSGLRSGDVLLRYGTTPLRVGADLKLRAEGDKIPVEIWRDGQTRKRTVAPGELDVVLHRQPAPVALREQREFESLMATTRGPVPKPLPGTRREVLALASLVSSDKARLLLGSQASEQELDSLAQAGRLADYRLLHFATHGEMDAVAASRSALLLAQDKLPDPVEQAKQGKKVYTGRLTVAALAKWKLDADLVTLSACDTALGKDSGGEGYLGFAQVLFQAGSHSLVLSRWKVADAATALFMVRFYENLLGKRPGLTAPLGRAAALREAQQWLRSLSRAEAGALTARLSGGDLRGTLGPLKPIATGPEAAPQPGDHPYAHPYYWSAFMLLGDPD